MTDTIQDFRKTCQAIGKAMEGWQFSGSDNGCCYLIPARENAKDYSPYRSHCQGIHLQQQKGRIRVTGCWPHGTRDGRTLYLPRDIRRNSPEITISASRSPGDIAADIHRRFLADYREIYSALAEHIAEQEAHQDRQADAVKELAEIIGTTPDTHRESTVSWFGQTYGHVRMNYGGESGEIEFRSVNLPLLKTILLAAREAGAFEKK